MCRWVAKNVVAAGLADRAELRSCHAIGHLIQLVLPSIVLELKKVEENKIQDAVHAVFNFKPAEIVSQLDLLRPILQINNTLRPLR